MLMWSWEDRQAQLNQKMYIRMKEPATAEDKRQTSEAYLRHPVVLLKISASEGVSGMPSDSGFFDRGMRILSVSSGSASLASFSFRLSLDERFHRIPAQKHRKANCSFPDVLFLNLGIKTCARHKNTFIVFSDKS